MKFGSNVLTIFVVVTMASGLCIAQPGGGGPGGGATPAPLSGIEWLLLSGGIFGASRIYRNFRKK